MRLFRKSFRSSIYVWMVFLMVNGGLLSTFSSCSSDETSIDQTKFTPSADSEIYFSKSLDFDSDGGESTVTFTTNQDWIIDMSQSGGNVSWCTVSPMQGKAGTNTVKVWTEANTTYDERNVTLTFTAKELTQKMIITQKQKDALTLTTAKYEIGVEGGNIQVEVKANVSYEVQIPEQYQTWIHKISTRGLSSSTLSFTIDKSKEYDKREGEIIIKSGSLSETLKVYQAGSAILLLTQNEYTISSDGGQIAVELSSNFEYEVKMPQVEWITTTSTRSVSSHTLYYTINSNTTYDSRTAEIIYFDKNSNMADTLKIVQLQKDAIIISKKEYEVPIDGGILEIEVSTNVDYEVFIPMKYSEWIKKTVTRGLVSSTLHFQVLPNKTEYEREGFIIVKTAFKNDSVKVIQEGMFLTINVAKAGTLPDLIDPSEKMEITHLKLKGKLNGTDILYIREMAGVDYYGMETKGELRNLDMSETRIVTGGAYYFQGGMYGYSWNVNADNQIGWYMFYKTKLSNIILPNTIDVIGGYAFQNCYNLTSIDIPKSVNNIREKAFSGCNALTNINADKNSIYYATENGALYNVDKTIIYICPKGLTHFSISDRTIEIALGAFDDCINLESIYIPNSVRKIGNSFNNCTKLTTIEIPEGVQTVGGFIGCKALAHISIPNTVTNIYGFAGCTNLATIAMPNSVKTIAKEAFKDCTNLTSIKLPYGLKTISSSTFENCKNLSSVTIPKNVTAIESSAFKGCTSLSQLNIPTSVTFLGEEALSHSGITSINLPNSLTVLPRLLFSECINLASVTIPSSITEFGRQVFWLSRWVKDIYLYIEIPLNLSYDSYVFYGVNTSTCVLHVPKGSKEAYSKAEIWKEFSNIVEME